MTTSNVKLLPLPEELKGHGKSDAIRDYARANVAHATAPLQAEIEALRAEVERLQSINSGLCRKSNYYLIDSARWQELAEWLAEALRPLAALDPTADGFDQRPDSQPIYARYNTVITVGDVRKARAALHHTDVQENSDA
jgi:hypothetical protein